jgi:hypothetical protein
MRDTIDLGWLRDLESSWESWADLVTDAPVDAPGNPFARGLLISLHIDAGVLFLDPVALLADPVLAYILTPERGRAYSSKPRSGR